MRLLLHILYYFLICCFLFSQTDDGEGSGSRELQGAFGAVTIDGKIWNQIALRPVLPFGKLSIEIWNVCSSERS